MNKKDRESYPAIDLRTEKWHEDQCFADGESAWLSTTLWDAAKDLPSYEVPIVGMDITIYPWAGVGDDFLEFCRHAQLVMDADLDYPIILTPNGRIADGRHRLAKAIILGHSTINIVRLAFMPDPDFVDCDDE